MTETQITRVCEKCNLEKRTTVYLEEERTYFCEDCLKTAGRRELLLPKGRMVITSNSLEDSNPLKWAVILIIAVTIGLLVGKFLV